MDIVEVAVEVFDSSRHGDGESLDKLFGGDRALTNEFGYALNEAQSDSAGVVVRPEPCYDEKPSESVEVGDLVTCVTNEAWQLNVVLFAKTMYPVVEVVEARVQVVDVDGEGVDVGQVFRGGVHGYLICGRDFC